MERKEWDKLICQEDLALTEIKESFNQDPFLLCTEVLCPQRVDKVTTLKAITVMLQKANFCIKDNQLKAKDQELEINMPADKWAESNLDHILEPKRPNLNWIERIWKDLMRAMSIKPVLNLWNPDPFILNQDLL